MKSAFNTFLDLHALSLLMLASFTVLMTIRLLIADRRIFVAVYHGIFFLLFAITAIGGGGVQNDGYERFEEFKALEHNHQLDNARKHPQHYSSMLQIDLQEFRTSREFQVYLEQGDRYVDRAEAIYMGWIFIILFDILLISAKLLKFSWVCVRKFKQIISHKVRSF